jgi:hypothetical protein
MKIQIKEITRTETLKEIEIELPYYFKHEMDLDRGKCTMYGKLTESECFEIEESYFDEHSFKNSIESNIRVQKYSCYVNDDNKSTKEEFESIIDRAKVHLMLF